MTAVSTLLKIVLAPTLHFLFAVLAVGAGWLAIARGRFRPEEDSPAGNLLCAAGLGILHNTLQFALILALLPHLPPGARAGLGLGKYAVDLAFIVLLLLAFRAPYLALIRRMAGIIRQRDDAILLLFAILLGTLAVVNFPHVHDSGQLFVTNDLLAGRAGFLAAKRYGLGFSALLYFPCAVHGGLPMGTLAAGFKPFLLLLAGLAAVYGGEKLSLGRSAATKSLYFIIIVSSYFGLYGMMVLGKDSAWSALFSLVFILSLLDRERRRGWAAPAGYALAAAALGMIAVPYLAIFVAVAIAVHLLPREAGWLGIAYSALLLLVLGACFLLMPARLAISPAPALQPALGKIVYWAPTDGSTSFARYFFAWHKFGYRNSPPLIVAAMLGILLLPLFRNRFRDLMARSAALFLPVATLACLFLAFLARGFIPASRDARIPFTPLTTFDAWNLVKDIPQWYLQIVGGIFFLILLEEVVARLCPGRIRRLARFGAAALAAVVIVSANLAPLAGLRNPAHFHAYGGNKNESLSWVLETIHRHPRVRNILVMRGVSSLRPHPFFYEVKSYFSGRRVLIDVTPQSQAVLSLAARADQFLVIAGREELFGLVAALRPQRHRVQEELRRFRDGDEGIYLVGRTKERPAPRRKLPPAGG
jgi:hypothetical protein